MHYNNVLPWVQLVDNLTGQAPQISLLRGSFLNDQEVESDYESNFSGEARNVLMQTLYAKVILLYLCADYEQAYEVIQRLAKLPQEASTIYIKLFHAVFSVLNLYALGIQTNKSSYAKKAKTHLATIKTFDRAGSPNVPSMSKLLRAELLTLKGQPSISAYTDAIEGLASKGFRLLEAIAYERLGLSLQHDDKSREYIEKAAEAFDRYGATAKAELLRR